MMVQKSSDGFFTNDIGNSPTEQEIVPEHFFTFEFDEEPVQKDHQEGMRNRIMMAVFFAAASLFGAVITYAVTMLINHSQAVKVSVNQVSSENVTNAEMPTITVDVHGDVLHPGVYRLSSDSRILDAIEAAGGYLHKEDSQFVNQAQPLVDGQEIVVTSPILSDSRQKSGQSGQVQPDSGSKQPQNEKIDLNTADESTLETIPGIGPKRAAAIVEFRNSHGPFASINDLEHVHGFGQSTLSKLGPYLSVQTNHSFQSSREEAEPK